MSILGWAWRLVHRCGLGCWVHGTGLVAGVHRVRLGDWVCRDGPGTWVCGDQPGAGVGFEPKSSGLFGFGMGLMPESTGTDLVLSLWGLAWYQGPQEQAWSLDPWRLAWYWVSLEPEIMVMGLEPESVGVDLGPGSIGEVLEPRAIHAGPAPGFTGTGLMLWSTAKMGARFTLLPP